ncbi:MAG TPA: M48 family metallopeptidase [Gemmatimonadales bacterium]|nr:M48 family metallopeptidase [Gemmatimonadales bacterium]
MTAANLFAQQESNRRHTVWLVSLFVLFFAWVGFGGDLAMYVNTAGGPPGSYHHTIPFIGVAATLFALGVCRYSWTRGADRVLWATGAEEIVEPLGEAQQQLVNVVEEMAIASGQPRPRIWIVPDDDPNAFATGIDPAHASIAVTRGLLGLLNREELQAVVAHEMAHVQNYDTRLMTMLAAMVGAIALMSDGFGRSMRFGGRSSSSGSGGKDSNPLGIIILVAWLLTLIIAPLVSNLLSMAVSRKREYLADATGSQFTRNPGALASALQKLDAAAEPTRAITRGAAHLCIVDPAARKISEREGLLGDVFASHPPIRQRIIRLNGMAYQIAKTGGISVPSAE